MTLPHAPACRHVMLASPPLKMTLLPHELFSLHFTSTFGARAVTGALMQVSSARQAMLQEVPASHDAPCVHDELPDPPPASLPH